MGILNRYERITFRGKTVDRYTAAALLVAEKRLGFKFTITQGSYNAGGVEASGGTHDGGGVVDLPPTDDPNRTVRELRRVGFAAWYRPELYKGTKRIWGDHIHAVQIGNKNLSPAAVKQVEAYKQGRNGLADNGPDTGPLVRWRVFRYADVFRAYLPGDLWR